MVDHQHPAAAVGQVDQCLGFPNGGRERLLDEYVQPGLKAALARG